MSTPALVGACRSRSSDNVRSELKLGKEAPVWVPDTASINCQECRKNFTFLVRRHHCRSCGRLLCSQCSSFTAPLHYLNWTVSRVCQSCKILLDSPGHPPQRSRSLSSIASQEENLSKLVREMQVESFRKRSCEAPTTSCLISSLPREILSKIFNFLGHSDKKVCRHVCQYWSQVVETSDFFHTTIVHIKDVNPDKARELIDRYKSSHFENLRFSRTCMLMVPSVWGDMSERLRALELEDCEITEKEVTSILQILVNLRTLSLVNCRDVFISGTFLSSTADRLQVRKNLSALKQLTLNENKYLSDILLIRITDCTPVLQYLRLSGCNIMNDAGIYLKHYPTSQEIQASPSVLTWRILVQVVGNLCRSLRGLDVSKNTGVDLELLSEVPGLNLHELILSGCGSVTQQGLLRILRCSPQLNKLNLNMCRRTFSGLPEANTALFKEIKAKKLFLSVLSVSNFHTVAHVQGLTHLEMNGLDSPGSEIVSAFQSLNTKSLVTLKARFLSAPCQDLANVLKGKDFSSLCKLDLSSGAENCVTDFLLQAICVSMRNLTCLNLSNNSKISDIGTIGISSENMSPNSLQEIKELMNRNNRVPLGSKFENEMKASTLRREMMVESLLEQGLPEAGLFLLTKLVELNLSYTAVSSLTLKIGISAPDLRFCNLESCTVIEDAGLYDFAIRHTHLEKLMLGATPVTNTGLISCLSCLPRLVCLDVTACKQLSSAGLRALSQVAPQIERLSISNCANISLEAARSAELSLPNLSSIQYHGLQSEHGRFPQYLSPPPPRAPTPPPPPLSN